MAADTLVVSDFPATAAHGVVWFGDAISQCNECFSRMMGYDRALLIGKSPLEISPEFQADGAFSRERWDRRLDAVRAGAAQWFAWQFRNAEGQRTHALVHLTWEPTREPRYAAHIHDLSNLQRAAWVKLDSEMRLRQVLDQTKAVIFVKDRQGRYVFANRELERVVRMPAERMVGRTDQEIWPPDVAVHFQANDAEALTRGSGTEFEVTTNVGRQRKTFLSFKFPLVGPDGEAYAVCGVATDITDSKRTQDALTRAALAVSSAQGTSVFQELVRYLATILDVDAASIAVHDAVNAPSSLRTQAFYLDGGIQDNFEYPAAGTPCAAVIGQSFRFFPNAVRAEFPEDVTLGKSGFNSYAGFPLTDAGGASIGLISVMSRRAMVNGEFIESILKIFAVRAAAELERQRSEETLRRSEASYRAIFESSEDAVFIHDWDTGAVVDVNRRACEVYGYSYEEMKQITLGELSSGEYPYTGEEAARQLQAVRAGGPVRMEWHRRNKDGSLHWDEVVLRPAVIAGELRILAFTREITERKQAEHALRQAQKMEALGHLTGGIAHDFNNLLTSIMGYVVLAADHPTTAKDARLGKYLEQARLSCVRARDLIQQMLTFSRGQRGQPRPVALPALVGESLQLFGSSMPSTLELTTELDPDVAAVMLDPVHLDQILLNLCLNACDAMNGAGTIRVCVGAAQPGERECTACRKTAAGDFVELCVEDNGPGIAPEILDRIFEPFFTTKEVGKGTGMGLASVHGIVHELGGHIVVTTAPGRGTRFCVLLPALAGGRAHAAAAPAAAPPVTLAQLQGHVLVVDDEKSVGAFMRDLLESWGLTVTIEHDSTAAAAMFARDPRRFDLVITDQAMPRMTGIELARTFAAARPELPVILYTGFNEGIPRAEIDAARLRAVITKPIDPHALFGLLQTHLPRAAA